MAYAISWNMDEGQKNSVFLCLNNRLCESRYLLHVCCEMSHKTITCECEGESLVTVTCYEISDLRDVTVAALWRRQVIQAVDITHPMLVMILVLSCTHLHLTSHMSVDSMLSTARIWSHVTAHSTHSPLCLLTQYPGQTALPSLLFSAPAQLSSLQATWPGCGLPGSLQAREKLTGHNETLRPGPGSRKTRRYSLTCCFVLKLITFELKTFNIWNILISFEILRNAVVLESYEIV